MPRATAFVISAVCVALAVSSGWQLLVTVRNSDTVVAGEKVGASEILSPEVLQRVASGLALEGILKTCRTDLLRPALFVQLAALDTVSQQKDDARWLKYVDGAKRFLQHMERCNPANGDVWLRDAMLSHALGEDTEGFHDKVTLSSALMPNYRHEVSARVSLWSSMTEQALETYRDFVIADLSIILHYFPRREAKQLLIDTPPSLSPFMKQALAAIPQDRIVWLMY